MICPIMTEIDSATVERLRAAGFVIVPLSPSEEMLKVGAPCCYQPNSPARADPWDVAMLDATECYRAMIELGCL